MKIDKDGLILCDLQGDIFEMSSDETDCSSDIFIRRFIHSNIVKEFDSKSILDNSITKKEVFNLINDEFGETNYGQIKYNKESLFWIGYIYRYMAYILNMTSKQVYKIIKPKELNELYYIYHTFDPEQAIERILENKNISLDNEAKNKLLFKLLRKQRNREALILTDNIDSNLISEDSNNIVLSIKFNNNIIGYLKLIKLLDNTYEINIIVDNYSEYKSKELDEIVIEKLIDYVKKIENIEIINVNIDKNDDRLLNIYKQNGFEYINDGDETICLYRKFK